MRFLIDGYNLMHALGMAPAPGSASLARSRLRFVDWLAVESHGKAANLSVVFDSVHAAGGGEQTHRGIQLRFADARTADDLIEEIIRAEPVPARLTVVSNDHRLLTAATRGGCVAWTCGKFVDWLQTRTKSTSDTVRQEPEKPAVPSGAEMVEWLERFGS